MLSPHRVLLSKMPGLKVCTDADVRRAALNHSLLVHIVLKCCLFGCSTPAGLELVPLCTWQQYLSTWLLRSWSWQETLPATTRRLASSPGTGCVAKLLRTNILKMDLPRHCWLNAI